MEKFYHNIPNQWNYSFRVPAVLFGDIPMENGRIFLISTDQIMRNYLKSFISRFDQQVYMPSNPENFLEELESIKPSVVVYDILRINPETLQQLQFLTRLGQSSQVILLSGQMQLPLLQDLTRPASWRILTKPFLPQELKTSVLEAFGKLRGVVLTPAEIIAQTTVNGKRGYHPQLLLETSPRMQEVRAVIDHVANTDVTILIRGESGTGKELVARSLSECSNRAGKPFVTVLCPAIPEGLLESELFGYEKGSFTGAFRRRPGKFEIANHGTIFLDEIGDIPFELQSKLLHVLQRGEFSLIGGNELKVDVRILAATNKDLEKAVADGTFREDLYYRLNVVSIFLPPLRERREDIPLLVECFLQKYNQQYNKECYRLSPATLQSLMDYDWPGNVREMENLIKRVVIMGREDMVVQQYVSDSRKKIRPKTVPVASAPVEFHPPAPEKPRELISRSPLTSLKHVAREAMKKAEGEAILKALEQTRWNRKAAARLLQISYKALLYKIRQCNLDGEPDPSGPVS
ncbi:MAG: sigma-54-dependent Fis family transcriptional regulator [Nitrospirae bacterium]|nr:sigma-54-dependent Fis family transcriptional regulator [Nitrospirota bacterium]